VADGPPAERAGVTTQRVRIQSQGLRLRAELALPAGPGPFPGVVMCHPHPLYGGDMENNVVMGVHEALIARGLATLRFNFRGAGGSEGVHDNGVGEVEDALAALRFLSDTTGVDSTRLGLAGYSFGAGVAFKATSALPPQAEVNAPLPEVRALAVVGCPPRMLETQGSPRSVPRLFIAGERDHIASPQALKPVVARLPQPTDLVAVPGADHFFLGKEKAVGTLVGDFMTRWLAPPESSA